jgi:hypothetical protein
MNFGAKIAKVKIPLRDLETQRLLKATGTKIEASGIPRSACDLAPEREEWLATQLRAGATHVFQDN